MTQTSTKTLPFDYAHSYTNTLKLRAISVSSTVLAVLIATGSVLADKPYQRWLLLGSALGITQVGRLASEARITQDRINQDYIDISDASRQQVVYRELTAKNVIEVETEEEETKTLDLFDLSTLSDQNHVAVVGPSGSGKTVLTQWLISKNFPSDTAIAIYDTDASPNDWAGQKVIGKGGDVGSIRLAMTEDLVELQTRTEKRATGKDVGKPVVRVVEEFPSLVGDINDELVSKQDTNEATAWLKKLLRRGRKYGMGAVLVSQEFEVEALGIKGEGNIRKGFTVVYLGGSAINQLDSVRDKEYRQQLREALEVQRRPCLVEVGGKFQVANIPDLTRFARELEDYSAPINRPSSTQTPNGREDSPTTNTYSQTDSIDPSSNGRAQAKTMSREAVLTIPIDADITLPSGKTFLAANVEWLHRTIQGYRAEGHSMSRIIKDKLSMSGRNYEDGVALWDELSRRYGDEMYPRKNR